MAKVSCGGEKQKNEQKKVTAIKDELNEVKECIEKIKKLKVACVVKIELFFSTDIFIIW